MISVTQGATHSREVLVPGATMTHLVLQSALWTVAANYHLIQHPQPANRALSISTILEQRKTKPTAISLPESRIRTGWMCQLCPSVELRVKWDVQRATADSCELG